LRYFFGKRMGVADFVDEQRYHASKQRFHNQRLHGAGVLCGLAVRRESTTDPLLRVTRGAALDPCGREIVVGYDQCIELDAWFQRELAERRELDSTWPTSALDSSGGLPLVVLLRYRDCAMSPEPAPRDTCSCDAAGCDFGRVREEFELELVPANDPRASGTLPLAPPRAAIERAVGAAVGGAALTRGLALASSAGCPEPASDTWLRLASFTAVLGTTGSGAPQLTDLGELRGEGTLLAQTAVLQDLLARELGAQLEPGALNEGPEATALVLEAEASPSTFQRIYVELSLPVIAETVPTGAFTLSRLARSTEAAPGWSNVPCQTSYVGPTTGTPPRLQIRVDNAGGALAVGGLYRLALDPARVSPSRPIMDDSMRPLRPLRGIFQFSIGQDGADLIAIEPPYAR